ncbi:MAG: hypothetical protein ACLGG5_08830, partial [Thermoleophilia bacterium]
ESVTATTLTPISPDPVDFGFLPGFSAPATEVDGSPTGLAGSHPYQMTIDLNFPTEQIGQELTGAGHPHDVVTALPRGLVGDPAATPILCTEAELITQASPGCPPASQVGLVDVTTTLGERGNGSTTATSNLYAMVPPPGAPAAFGFDAVGAGIFVHLVAGLRSDSDYSILASTDDLLALPTHPIFNVQAQLWGDPSGKEHDQTRGACQREGTIGSGELCAVFSQPNAFLTMPGDCPGTPPLFEAQADSWEEPSPPFPQKTTFYESANLDGEVPVSIKDCGALAFEPQIQSRPTTNRTDSPSGLDFFLHLPQDTKLDSRSPAQLRDAAVRFPAGLAVNPSQGSGLGACTEAQIGFHEEDEEGRLDFSKEPQSCPDAAKLGTVEVTSPLLVQRNEAHEVALDPQEGTPIPEPLHGSLYLAKPFANPFGSLVAVYLVIEDQRTGIVAKLAGEGELDPATGQVTTYFEENPELPLEDVRVHLFGGARGAFTTPPTCGKFTTETDLTPWSSPEGEDAFPEDSFQTALAPGGGPCPAGEAQMPNAPKLSAGTASPQAGAYSPLLFKLTREDGSQRWQRLEATLPLGLSAKLAGVGECSEPQIAQARAREKPNAGVLEQQNPSCPAASRI